MKTNQIPTDEKELKGAAFKSLHLISYHLNRVRAIGNRSEKTDTKDIIIASLKKTKTILTQTLKEIDS